MTVSDEKWSIPASLSPDEALAALTEPYMVARGADVEGVHQDADDILCALLTHLGHNDVVMAWNVVRKWYA